VILSEITFLLALWKANLLSAMEYRVAFLTQMIGMMLNDGVYFLFWVIFFDRFKQVRGWGISEMFLLFGIVAAAFGASDFLFGNFIFLVDVINSGRLDYYLSMPRPVLLHVLASRSRASGLGDTLYGLISFFLARQYTLDAFLRFLLGAALSMVVILSFMILVQSLSFWLGNIQLLSQQASNAIVTFSIYPITLFEGGARFFLFTLVPAAFVGALPAEIVLAFTWERFGQLVGAALLMLCLAVAAFYRGLKRYESGSGIQVEV
jgi:ABC-2 type transport system permease protein